MWRRSKIGSEYDLTLAEVYAALAYYHDHRAKIVTALRTSDVFVEELRAADSVEDSREARWRMTLIFCASTLMVGLTAAYPTLRAKRA